MPGDNNKIIRNYGEAYAGLSTSQDEYIFSWVTEEGFSAEFIICDVFLNAVFAAANPGPHGWEGMLLQYHCNMEWLDDPWRLSDLSSEIEILKSISSDKISEQPFGEEALEIFKELLIFLMEGAALGFGVVVAKR